MTDESTGDRASTVPAVNGGSQRWATLDEAAAQTGSVTTLVVGFDRRAESHTALGVAADLAKRLNARLVVVHAVNLNDYPIDPDSSDWEEQARRALVKERADVTAILSDHTGGWSYHAWPDDPAQMLRTAADDHDALMIIVGTRGEGWRPSLERLFGSSVSHSVIHHGRRPVLVVSSPSTPAEP